MYNMAVETELKLSIAPEQLNRLRRHPSLKALATTRAATCKLHNIYYDTPALDLHRGAMALRLRRVGKGWLQTLKSGGSVQAGLHLRNEWETPVPGEALDFNALQAIGGRLPKGVRNKLQPVFTTDFSRNQRLLKFEDAEIELSLDSGEIRAGKNIRPISELELELKSGSPQQLFRLAQALLDIVPLQVENTSKAEYGYLLFSGDQPTVLKASFPPLDKAQNIASALQNMIACCLRHVQANVPGAIRKLDEEYLHQVRVGLRRLRVVLAMAEACRADAELGTLHDQVADLCVELGRAREWDVFVTQTLEAVHARLPEHGGLHALLETAGRIREQYQDKVRARLQSSDYQRFLLHFGAWMQGGYWHEIAGIDMTLPDFACGILQKRSKQVHKRGQNLVNADALQLHALRIACKKLRYGAEMFAALYGENKTRRYLGGLSGLQDILGQINDIAVARRLLNEVDDEGQHETIILILGWLEHDYAGRLVELGTAWKRFAGNRPFWNGRV
ncbi:MAG: CHAD domain-containing protein [Gallionellaceae bacterium]